jgi:hypothetical protein
VRKALAIGFVAALVGASVASARVQSLGGAVRATESAPSFRYAISIAVVRDQAFATGLNVRGVSGPGQLSVHVQQIPGGDAAAMIDGPFLYERAPSGAVVTGSIRWLRVPIASIGRGSPVLNAVRSMTPLPLLRVLGESHARLDGAGAFAGTVHYDDPIVRAAITRFSGGVEFRDVRVTAQVGNDGLIDGIRVTGTTADGTTTLEIKARLYAFGRPVHLTPPAEGTFMDQQLLHLAE